jgi:hypothetical protein
MGKAQKKEIKSMSSTKKKLLVDSGVFLLFVFIAAPESTGIAIHEWVSIIFVAPVLVHLLLNWNWIVKVTGRLFRKMPGETRFNYVWDFLLFIFMVIVMASGILISESALPAFGIIVSIDPFWAAVHDVSANLLLLMVGVHLAMHWTWILNAFKKYLFRKTKTSTRPTGGQLP